MKYNNQQGVTLIMVLILLVAASVLIGSLFIVARSHIDTVSREEANIKAFYNADSGVEFVKANLENIEFNNLSEDETNKYLQFDADDNLIFTDNKYYFDGNKLNLNNSMLNFSLEASKKSGIYKFTSTGKYQAAGKEFIKRINFELETNKNNFNKLFNVQTDNENIELKGKAADLDEELLTMSATISPSWDKWQSLRDDADNWSDIKQNGKNNLYQGIIANKIGDLKLNNKDTFLNSILFIDGDLTIGPQNEWENSIIILNGNLKTNGFPTHGISNSVFFIYNADTIHLAGNFPDNIEREIDFSTLPSEFNQSIDNILPLSLKNWQQN